MTQASNEFRGKVASSDMGRGTTLNVGNPGPAPLEGALDTNDEVY